MGRRMAVDRIGGMPVVTSKYVPTTETVVDHDNRSILRRMFTAHLAGVRTKDVPCEHVYVVDGTVVVSHLKVFQDP